MIRNNELVCPNCGGYLKSYDSVRRVVRGKKGSKNRIKLRRLVCVRCGSTHRELPSYLVPYRQYSIQIIEGFLSGTITSFDLDYEDYPCDSTIAKWKNARKKHLL